MGQMENQAFTCPTLLFNMSITDFISQQEVDDAISEGFFKFKDVIDDSNRQAGEADMMKMKLRKLMSDDDFTTFYQEVSSKSNNFENPYEL